MDIQYWVDESGRIAEEHGWDEREVPFPETLALIHSELSEALEEYRQGHEYAYVYYPTMVQDIPVEERGRPFKPEGISVEIIDVLIRIFHWASINEINLGEVLSLKSSYNDARPYRHGGLKA